MAAGCLLGRGIDPGTVALRTTVGVVLSPSGRSLRKMPVGVMPIFSLAEPVKSVMLSLGSLDAMRRYDEMSISLPPPQEWAPTAFPM
jgi:hypothetical protein